MHCNESLDPLSNTAAKPGKEHFKVITAQQLM